MALLLLFAFVSGLLTIFAPCVWPLLPVVLSASTVGNRRSPLGIVLGLMGSFGLVTLGASYAVQSLHVDPDKLRLFAVIVIAYLGISMLIPDLERVHQIVLGGAVRAIRPAPAAPARGLGSGALLGISLGIVWSPCAGPILATITALAVTARVSTALVFVTSAYLVGVGIPLFAFAYGGQRLLRRLTILKRFPRHAHRVFGMVIVLTALGIYSNYDKVLAARLSDLTPQYSGALIAFERDRIVTQRLALLNQRTRSATDAAQHRRTTSCPKNLCDQHYRAPEFVGISHWLNTARPLTMRSLRGRVVLIHFWTFDCINCIHTLSKVEGWYEKYRKNGFVVIGVHSPEFAYEKVTSNVQAALGRFNIRYPVPQDNDLRTWDAFQNAFWPAEYLIDAHGFVRFTYAGEGNYGNTETAIRDLLGEAGHHV